MSSLPHLLERHCHNNCSIRDQTFPVMYKKLNINPVFIQEYGVYLGLIPKNNYVSLKQTNKVIK